MEDPSPFHRVNSTISNIQLNTGNNSNTNPPTNGNASTSLFSGFYNSIFVGNATPSFVSNTKNGSQLYTDGVVNNEFEARFVGEASKPYQQNSIFSVSSTTDFGARVNSDTSLLGTRVASATPLTNTNQTTKAISRNDSYQYLNNQQTNFFGSTSVANTTTKFQSNIFNGEMSTPIHTFHTADIFGQKQGDGGNYYLGFSNIVKPASDNQSIVSNDINSLKTVSTLSQQNKKNDTIQNDESNVINSFSNSLATSQQINVTQNQNINEQIALEKPIKEKKQRKKNDKKKENINKENNNFDINNEPEITLPDNQDIQTVSNKPESPKKILNVKEVEVLKKKIIGLAKAAGKKIQIDDSEEEVTEKSKELTLTQKFNKEFLDSYIAQVKTYLKVNKRPESDITITCIICNSRCDPGKLFCNNSNCKKIYSSRLCSARKSFGIKGSRGRPKENTLLNLINQEDLFDDIDYEDDSKPKYSILDYLDKGKGDKMESIEKNDINNQKDDKNIEISESAENIDIIIPSQYRKEIMIFLAKRLNKCLSVLQPDNVTK